MTLNSDQILIHRYQIQELLGQGGFGAVYKAWDLNLKVPCAVKENFETNPSAVRQFEREATMLAMLRHPNLPRVTDHFRIEEQGQYLVMDYIEGDDLQTLLLESGGPLPEEKVLRWLAEVCDALAYLHSQPIPVFHRDIKPPNIKITPAGSAVLVDFGIAKTFDPANRTTQGARAITPGFSPFEQYGQAPTDARSDIYSLGATAFILLTGQAPSDSIARMAGAQLPQPRILNPALSERVERAILHALELMPDQRFQRVVEFKQALTEETGRGQYVMVSPIHAPEVKATMKAPEAVGEKPGETLRAYPATQVSPAPRPPQYSRPASQPVSRKSSSRWIGIGIGIFALLILGLLAVGGLAFALGLIPTGAPPTVTNSQAAGVPTTTTIAALPSTPTESKPTAPKPTAIPTDTRAPTEASPLVAPGQPAFKACQVTDTGGIDDKSFNATAWMGVIDAMKTFGIEGKYLEAQQGDYEKHILTFIEQEKCDIIITVGFLQADATRAAAEKYPTQKFSIVDSSFDPVLPNVMGQVFAIDQASFLAGYVAAGMTKTGKVGAFGGLQIPPVTAFMDGFDLGVRYFNQVHSTKIELIGWDMGSQSGIFIGNFESSADGRAIGEKLMADGVDVLMPVAGPAGLGSAAGALERGSVYIIGVDSDWYETAPDYRKVILTSVLKKSNITTFEAIKAALEGNFKGGVMTGDLGNGGVGLAPFHDFDPSVPDWLKVELEKIAAEISLGAVQTHP
jgi:basic membrane protein A